MDKKKQESAELQILEKQKVVDYDIKEFTIELLVSKYISGKDEDENEIFIPSYQRNFTWDPLRQSKFIESVLLGLPIPYIFTADVDEGRLEIVDGSQRLRTLESFMSGRLSLKELEILDNLNGFSYSDLTIARQRKFKNSTIRMIALSDKSDEEIRFMMFERINTGSDLLKDMEKRKGIYGGKFVQFVFDECAKHPLYIKNTTFTDKLKKRGEAEELIIRFFAYSDNYQNFTTGVNDFLNDYTEKQNKKFEKERLWNEFDRMLNFIENNVPNGFKKSASSNKTPRVRFEALSVGINLALRENPNKTSGDMSFLNKKPFINLVTGGSHNSPTNVKNRIEFVRDQIRN